MKPLTDRQQALLQILKENPKIKLKQAAAMMGETTKVCYNTMQQLRTRGLIAPKKHWKDISYYPCRGKPGRCCLECDLLDCELPYWRVKSQKEEKLMLKGIIVN